MEIDERVGNVVVTVVLDNLVKGAAGQAIQNCNLMMGFEETLGLTGIGVAP
jgi:N-acetyl-gamma-glutamyl-phosphate reductase